MPNPFGPVLSNLEIKTIGREELRQKLARGDRFKLVMCLGEWEFRAKHIAGSIHFNTTPELLAGLKKDEEIVVYCSNPECLASVAAYQRLVEHGHSSVRRYSGGVADWESAGLPLEGEWVGRGSKAAG
ncbi:MAG TPA: rhodanese-like domain-containing protein [Polyangiaceae bacterium]|nr:rhodanese-like domain-containing protein [Polyangiaceae bacterium]